MQDVRKIIAPPKSGGTVVQIISASCMNNHIIIARNGTIAQQIARITNGDALGNQEYTYFLWICGMTI